MCGLYVDVGFGVVFFGVVALEDANYFHGFGDSFGGGNADVFGGSGVHFFGDATSDNNSVGG